MDRYTLKLMSVIHRSQCISISIGVICQFAGAPAFATGPDLIVGEIGVPVDGDIGEAFLTLGPVGGVMAYGFSTEACNVGDAPVSWVTNGLPEQRNQHPVIAQNMFRLKDGRFEQIGQSWLKHAFCGTNESLCGTCPVENQTGCGSLAVGCSDPYGASLNTEYQFFHLRLGPKSDVNAATGYFPFESSDNPCGAWCPLPTFTEVDRRMQVPISDIDPVLNAGAQYFIEGQYISPDESAAGNGADNVSWREIAIDPVTLEASVASGSMTRRQAPAIFAWQAADPMVTLSEVIVADDGGSGFDGHLWVAAKATDIGGGVWHYEYAVQNVTSDRSIQRFSIPLPTNAQIMNIGFHDVDYHSGERLDSTDWEHNLNTDSIEWFTVPFAEDEFANALRWGTLYNFRFDADLPPGTGDVVMTMFKPGGPVSVNTSTVIPLSMNNNVPGDCNGDAVVNTDDTPCFVDAVLAGVGELDVFDLNLDSEIDGGDITVFVELLLD